jgi:hypothetical protein
MADPRLWTLGLSLALLVFGVLAARGAGSRGGFDPEELGAAPPALVLDVRQGGAWHRFVFPGTHGVLIGRSPSAAIRLAEPTASRVHARIERRASGVYVEDLGSRNGTLVNGTSIAREALLEPGDRVRVGSTDIVFVGLGEWK